MLLRLAVLCIILTLEFSTSASSDKHIHEVLTTTKSSASSPEILILDNVLKDLKAISKLRGKSRNPSEDGTQNQNTEVLSKTFFKDDESDLPLNTSFSSSSKTLVKRQCPWPECPLISPPLPPLPVAPYGPPPPPISSYVPPPPPVKQPAYKPHPTYIPRLPPPPPPPPTAAYRPPRPPAPPAPAYRPPRPPPPPPPPVKYPTRPTYRPPGPLPTPTCPPVFPNSTNQLENLKIFLSQAQQCNSHGCSNRCTGRRRMEQCTIDYETLVMRLALIEQKLNRLSVFESRLKVHVALLLNIQKDKRFPGKEGPKGSRGRKGFQGLKGPTGHSGDQGLCITTTVANPPAGPPGPRGNKGDPGHPGHKTCGCRGERGDVGPRGDNIQGPPGPPGYKGAKGRRGSPSNLRTQQ